MLTNNHSNLDQEQEECFVRIAVVVATFLLSSLLVFVALNVQVQI